MGRFATYASDCMEPKARKERPVTISARKERTLNDFVEKTNHSEYIFVDICEDLNDAFESGTDDWSSLTLMTYGYVMRAVVAALYIQGQANKEQYKQIKDRFKGIQYRTDTAENTVEFQEQAFAESVRIIAGYIQAITSHRLKSIVHIAEGCEIPSDTLVSDAELLRRIGVVNTNHIEKSNLISTTEYGRIIGIDAKQYLFRHLIHLGLITKTNKTYKLTDEGNKFGSYLLASDGGKYIGWNKELLDKILIPFVNNIAESLNFKLFHLTHITNLKSILEQGLKCHNNTPTYTNISNQNVNKYRQREIKGFGSLHDYVPLYFNPRNAMLFQTCKQFNNEIVILEIDKEIITKNYTLFCQGNAARSDSYITHCKIKVETFDWEMIYSKVWAEIGSGIVDEEIKSMMMSECLIYKSIPNSYIKRIHCKDNIIADKVLELLKINIQELQTSRELYF